MKGLSSFFYYHPSEIWHISDKFASDLYRKVFQSAIRAQGTVYIFVLNMTLTNHIHVLKGHSGDVMRHKLY